jgi:hypothetical protein
MSQWYEHQKDHGNHLWLYSERGLMSYLFCHLLADRLDFVLDNAKDIDGITLRQEIGVYRQHTTLTEYELGPQGFGTPDGSFMAAAPERRCFVFVEAKQDSFENSYKTPDPKTPEALSAPGLDIDKLCNENKFNSFINGQLELRWRFVNAVRASVQAGEQVVSERHVRVLPPDLMAGDRFYWRLFLRPDQNVKGHWRRVDMAGDLHCLYTRLKEVCDDERRNEDRNGFYLLSVTLDESPPDFESRVRLFDQDGNHLGTRRRVFWLNRRKIEESLTPI